MILKNHNFNIFDENFSHPPNSVVSIIAKALYFLEASNATCLSKKVERTYKDVFIGRNPLDVGWVNTNGALRQSFGHAASSGVLQSHDGRLITGLWQTWVVSEFLWPSYRGCIMV
ncbi:conserved hypothetical protein [Ricinus communis]|uniref:Uncharacterized protein n=1 Tax=Ricinus communis TaxID=3988 RepID=B9S4S7_RICCO|nr:conserved hypothetical protein [Ricinus communis]